MRQASLHFDSSHTSLSITENILAGHLYEVYIQKRAALVHVLFPTLEFVHSCSQEFAAH